MNNINNLLIVAQCIFIGIISAFTGIFYRNCLKMPNMIFNFVYRFFQKMHLQGGFKRWIVYPLGYCVYCSSTWIAIIAYIIIVHEFSLLIFIPVSIQHIVVMYFDKHYLNRKEFN